MSSWFYKLRRRKRGEPGDGAAGFADPPVAPAPTPVPGCSPNRASYYVPSRDRDRAVPPRSRHAAREDNPKLRDTQFPRSPQQPSDIVFDVVARRDDRSDKAMPELKLRPILTKPKPADGGAASDSSPTARVRPRFHAKPPPPPPPSRRRKAEDEACRRRSRRRRRGASTRLRWVHESLVVVKESADPEEDFLESMAEMIAANGGVRSPRGMEELLACYLALNAPDHHRAIVAAFRRAWVHLHSVPPPPPPPPPAARGRCMHESRLLDQL